MKIKSLKQMKKEKRIKELNSIDCDKNNISKVYNLEYAHRMKYISKNDYKKRRKEIDY